MKIIFSRGKQLILDIHVVNSIYDAKIMRCYRQVEKITTSFASSTVYIHY